MSVLLSPFAGVGTQFFDNNGAPLAGGLIYTYAAGTTTPETTYTSNTGATPNSNPIVLNSAGRLANEMWLTTATAYKFQLYTSASVLIATYDNISGAADSTQLANTSDVTLGDALIGFKQSNASGALTGAVGRTVHQKLQEVISVTDFGATGDGVTDDYAAIAAAIAAVPATGGTVFFPTPSSSYLCSATLTVSASKDGLKLVGAHKYVQIRFTSTTANGITIAGEHDNLVLENLDLYAVNNSSGIAIASLVTGSATPLRDYEIIDVNIAGFLQGIIIYGQLDGLIRGGRQSGQGAAVTGGIGIQLGYDVNQAGNSCVVDQVYVQAFFTAMKVAYATPVNLRSSILGVCYYALAIEIGTVTTSGACYLENSTIDIDTSPSGYFIGNYHRASTSGNGWSLSNRRFFGPNEVTKVRAFVATENQLVATSTATKVRFNGEDYDTNSDYDAATLYRFVTRIPGHYRVTVHLRWRAAAAAKPYEARIYLNGALKSYSRSWSAVAGPDTVTVEVNDIMYLDLNDYIEGYAYQEEGITAEISFGTTESYMGITNI